MVMQGRIHAATICTINSLGTEYCISNILQDVISFFKTEYRLAYRRSILPYQIPACLPAHTHALHLYAVDAFTTPFLPMVDFQDNDKFTEHKMRATGDKLCRYGQSRADWVWVNMNGNPNAPQTIAGRLPARLNAISKLRNQLDSWL